MDKSVLSCTQCGESLHFPRALAGKQAKCPKCSAILQIPAIEGSKFGSFWAQKSDSELLEAWAQRGEYEAESVLALEREINGRKEKNSFLALDCEAMDRNSPSGFASSEGSLPYEKEEKILAEIGQGYLTSLVTGFGLASNKLICTNRRIYGTGTQYSFAGRTSVSFVGDLASISSIGTVMRSNFWLLLIGIPLLLFFALGLLFIIAYFVFKQRHICVNIGESYYVSLRGISDKETGNFVRIAMLAKSKCQDTSGRSRAN